MPTYQELINKSGWGPPQQREYRLAKIQEIQKHTGRPLVLYAANFIKGAIELQPGIANHQGIGVLPGRGRDISADLIAQGHQLMIVARLDVR